MTFPSTVTVSAMLPRWTRAPSTTVSRVRYMKTATASKRSTMTIPAIFLDRFILTLSVFQHFNHVQPPNPLSYRQSGQPDEQAGRKQREHIGPGVDYNSHVEQVVAV